MIDFVLNLKSIASINITIIDVLDMIVVAFIIYHLLNFIHKTRAEQLIKGIILIFVVLIIASEIKMSSTTWILSSILSYGIIAFIIIFQPEIRMILEKMGTGNIKNIIVEDEKKKRNLIVNELIKAVEFFSVERIGALIVIEKNIALGDIVETGTVVDGEVTYSLLHAIFNKKSVLHDGAVIISNGKISAAGCFLPLSKSKRFENTIGTRHRAAVGISEVSDSVTIIISEETGAMSYAERGKLNRYLKLKEIEKKLYEVITTSKKKGGLYGLKNIVNWKKDV